MVLTALRSIPIINSYRITLYTLINSMLRLIVLCKKSGILLYILSFGFVLDGLLTYIMKRLFNNELKIYLDCMKTQWIDLTWLLISLL